MKASDCDSDVHAPVWVAAVQEDDRLSGFEAAHSVLIQQPRHQGEGQETVVGVQIAGDHSTVEAYWEDTAIVDGETVEALEPVEAMVHAAVAV